MEGSCRRDWLPQADEPECSNRDCSLPQYRSCRRDCEDHSRPSYRSGFQAPGQYALLRMQSVFGLVENHRMRTIHNLIGNFLAAMRRQAMHKNGVGLCARHQPAVDLITLKQIVAASAVAVAHGYPSVGDDAVSILDRFFRVGADGDRGAGGLDPFE